MDLNGRRTLLLTSSFDTMRILILDIPYRFMLEPEATS